jgi:hypothetical protein
VLARRHLAFMTLIWPAEWNFTHRGVVSETDKGTTIRM